MSQFVHLHVHSTYSLLDGSCQIKPLVAKAKALGMPACAITDHGNLFGVKQFYDTCRKAGVKPILGCEAYVAREPHTARNLRSGDHLILLAKNHTGYKNLIKLISVAHTDGFYYRPRIDKALLEKYHEGLIVSAACLAGEVQQFLMDGRTAEAEDTATWYKNLFGDDFYLEMMLHPCNDPGQRGEVYREQQKVNERILALGEKLGIKVIATNDVHFLNENEAEAHDVLICINTGKFMSDAERMRYTGEEWFKTYDEMAALFPDHPELLANTLEIADKVEAYELDSGPIMPVFPIPEDFATEAEYEARFDEAALRTEFGERFDTLGGLEKVRRIKYEADYLAQLTQLGAAKRWAKGGTPEIKERIAFELETIKTMGFPGYFLIVQDFIKAAREMGVIVGPGRGSAAGSAVAYCLGITNVDPVKYDLLFERFLNPDRISMPDIDIDFDDEGRQRVLDWVTAKYGQDRVAHIATFGTMAPKSCIKDTARVMQVPLAEATRLTKLVPDTPKISMEKALKESPALAEEKSNPDPNVRKIIELTEILDGTVRQSGVHACGVIISRDPLIETIPVMPTENEALLTTQYDGHYVEAIGLLKMDFLGLKTLSVIKECIASIKESRGVDIDIDTIPMDDKKTFKLFARGDTTGLFQFESDGMKKHLRALKPNRFEDLVAMNALYRPGPMAYIPQFTNRKNGVESISYDHPMMEPFLKDTYGITVYQEQVMLLSRALGNFTRGESDTLRKAMGKKQREVMDKLKTKFVEGCLANEKFVAQCPKNKTPTELCNKIWGDWESFAEYAFNKSHSVCYAYVAYQTGYLKAHYPAEYMCAQISSEMGNFDKMPVFISEAESMGYTILPPSINHSTIRFIPEKVEGENKLALRYGLAGIKGVGFGVAESLVAERRANGPYKTFDDFLERTAGSLNKKAIESLIMVGALQCFGIHRAALLNGLSDGMQRAAGTLRDRESGQSSMFDMWGDTADAATETQTMNDAVPPMSEIEALLAERDLLGIFVSGHPIQRHRNIVARFPSLENVIATAKSLPERSRAVSVRFCAFISDIDIRIDKSQEKWAILTLEDKGGVKQEVPIYGSAYKVLINDDIKKNRVPLTLNTTMCFCADVYNRNGEAGLRITDYMPVEQAPQRYASKVMLLVPPEHLNSATFTSLRDTLKKHPGRTPAQIVLRLDPATMVYINASKDLAVLPDEHFIKSAAAVIGAKHVHFGMAK